MGVDATLPEFSEWTPQQQSSNTITGRSHSVGGINFTTQDFNKLTETVLF